MVMPGIDKYLFDLLGIVIPWVQGSLITATLIYGLLEILCKWTKSDKDDKFLLRFKTLIINIWVKIRGIKKNAV